MTIKQTSKLSFCFKLSYKLLNEVEENIIVSQQKSRNARKGEKEFACYYLVYKSYILYKNLLALLLKSQFHASAYLTRGIIEIRADTNHIIISTPKVAQNFLTTYKLVRDSRIELYKTGKFDTNNLQKVEDWAKDKYGKYVSIRGRIHKLGEHVEYSYKLYCAYSHSSSVVIDDIYRKEEQKLILEQLFVSTDSFFEIIMQYQKYFLPGLKIKVSHQEIIKCFREIL